MTFQVQPIPLKYAYSVEIKDEEIEKYGPLYASQIPQLRLHHSIEINTMDGSSANAQKQVNKKKTELQFDAKKLSVPADIPMRRRNHKPEFVIQV